MVDINDNFLTECLLKEKPFMNNMRKSVQLESGVWMDR